VKFSYTLVTSSPSPLVTIVSFSVFIYDMKGLSYNNLHQFLSNEYVTTYFLFLNFIYVFTKSGNSEKLEWVK
jgi:hypothetical protein